MPNPPTLRRRRRIERRMRAGAPQLDSMLAGATLLASSPLAEDATLLGSSPLAEDTDDALAISVANARTASPRALRPRP